MRNLPCYKRIRQALAYLISQGIFLVYDPEQGVTAFYDSKPSEHAEAVLLDLREYKEELTAFLRDWEYYPAVVGGSLLLFSREVDRMLYETLTKLGVRFSLEDGELRWSHVADPLLNRFIAEHAFRIRDYLECTTKRGLTSSRS